MTCKNSTKWEGKKLSFPVTATGTRPTNVFWSNSKFNKNLECSSSKYTELIAKKFCLCHDNYTVVACANLFFIGTIHFKPEHCIFWSNFEFDRNIISGTGARVTCPICPKEHMLVHPGRTFTFWQWLLLLALPGDDIWDYLCTSCPLGAYLTY